MSHISLFFNTKIQGSGALAWVGDKGLAPLRYLFNGRTVQIMEPARDSSESEIFHIPSFHKSPGSYSYAWKNLEASPTSPLRGLMSVVLLIPGIVLSVFKLLAYCFSEMRERHQLAKEHFTPINREIGTAANPIRSIRQLEDALQIEKDKPKHQPTNALIIHGDGLKINDDPGILALYPMKLILDEAKIVHIPSSYFECLDDQMGEEWDRTVPDGTLYSSNIKHFQVSSVQEALKATAPRRGWFTCQRYHQVFTLDRPQ